MTNLEKFKAGCYVIPAPPVPTQHWTTSDWINYINTYGRWTA